ncbi:MAG: ECF RNA polymerase sigma factor SigK [Acidimicrobiia bacterium]
MDPGGHEGAPADSPPDLDGLLLRVAWGDRDSFEQLYDRVAGKVFGLVLRVLRNRAQAEEVSQEVLIEVWRHADRFKPARGHAMTWIMTIAHRRAVDRVRSEGAARSREERVGVNPGPAADIVADRVVEGLERDRVREALTSLTNLQREAIELAYFGGRTYREIAELLDTPLGTIKTRMRDAVIRLRTVLGDWS